MVYIIDYLLGPVSGNFVVPLTPNHFLHGQIGGEYAPEIQLNEVSLTQRWRKVQEDIHHFWKRWIKEWIPAIGRRNKWAKEKQNCNVGDVALVMWPDTPRARWPLGRVSDIQQGVDGKVRRVKVIVAGKEYSRGINTIYLLKDNQL